MRKAIFFILASLLVLMLLSNSNPALASQRAAGQAQRSAGDPPPVDPQAASQPAQELPEAAAAAPGPLLYDSTVQSAELFYNEAQVVYLTNLERRKKGIAPFRMNRELTYTTRWFAWDSVENRRPDGYCGHTDTLGRAPWDRSPLFGYMGFGNGENAVCGFANPLDAVVMWVNSPGHYANMIDEQFWETGVGYYRSPLDGRGYIAQQFGSDSLYPPMIIQNEAVNTTSPSVGLYLHSRSGAGGIQDMGKAVTMQVSNNACFTGAAWESYTPEKPWTLVSGTGWRTVYSKIRDGLGRTSQANDTIYLGSSVPTAQIATSQLSQTQPSVKLYGLNAGGYSKMQFSLGWVADDTAVSFGQNWGNPGKRVNDANAIGGTAWYFPPPSHLPGEFYEANAWIYTSSFIPNVDMVAYFRLKAASNASASEVARIEVEANGVSSGAVSIKGTDFTAANQYKEFAVPFRYTTNPDGSVAWLMFNVWRSAETAITFDAATIFTAGVAPANPYTWSIPGGHYRGQGVWVRYANSLTSFSGYSAAATAENSGTPAPTSLALTERDGLPVSAKTVTISAVCSTSGMSASAPAGWLKSQVSGGHVQVWASNMPPGSYSTTLTVTLAGGKTISVPVTLVVTARQNPVYLPSLARD